MAKEIEAERTGAKCLAISADVRDVKSMEDAVNQTIQEFGRIDFVIAGAAGNFLAIIEVYLYPMFTDGKNLSSNAFKTVLEIDTLGSYNTLKATIPHLKKSKGSILFVSATLHYRGTIMQAHVSAAKAAIDALSQVVTVEYGPFGVRSNVISPGGIAGTEGIERLMPKEVTEQATKVIPLGRLGTVEDIAECTGT
jgi:2,4-dienoyl-CoA reductase [(3E)-enoyl-CoA-producing], peroxisomal